MSAQTGLLPPGRSLAQDLVFEHPTDSQSPGLEAYQQPLGPRWEGSFLLQFSILLVDKSVDII